MVTQKSRYKSTPLMQRPEGQSLRLTPRPISITEGVLEHLIEEGNRLDHLARYYYNDDRMWWRIVDANPDFVFAGNVFTTEQLGQIILIPRVPE